MLSLSPVDGGCPGTYLRIEGSFVLDGVFHPEAENDH